MRLWAQSKANPVCRATFHRSCHRARAKVIDGASPNWAAYRAANLPICQKPLESAHALICSGLLPASNSLLTAHSRLKSKMPILASAITTKSKGPLTGMIELRTKGGPIGPGIDEDAALALRTDLERFLTR